ncbi:hypothetical protein ABI_39990 [Asticcacaulis biprosthecium C19]|uniref:Uncharacterized protein n=1 Tax=Asticcacaulis biprosthecium C19 TaxID=715226 RepID=F4QS62_9CAUL|nr:hypothetical protein ABI_39990 [Asticcacaulis biprosthecium C19]
MELGAPQGALTCRSILNVFRQARKDKNATRDPQLCGPESLTSQGVL